MAKRIRKKPDWLHAPQVIDTFSVSGCVSEYFADYLNYWRHNGYWFFDSPRIIKNIATENSIELEGISLFYYEAHEKEFDGEQWLLYAPEPSFQTDVRPPLTKELQGFDVLNFTGRTSPECSPLSCNSLAEKIPTNAHCLFSSFEDAERSVSIGAFTESEPGPYRIFAVYTADWR